MALTETERAELYARVDKKLDEYSIVSELTEEEKEILEYNYKHIYRPFLLNELRKSIQRTKAKMTEKSHPNADD